MAKKKALKIVVAEDEYLVLLGLKDMLEELGHEIIGEATNGEKAVKVVLEKEPDLLIIDINMPLLDGIDAIKKINKKSLLPSIIVTGYYNQDLIERATAAGAFSYLVKPIDEKDLKPAIDLAIARFDDFLAVKEELKKTKKALEARKYIERAKGILMDKYDLKEAEAMQVLQKKSRDRNKKLVVVAKEIIQANEILRMED